jgi:molybdate transport system substrate-binding protein
MFRSILLAVIIASFQNAVAGGAEPKSQKKPLNILVTSGMTAALQLMKTDIERFVPNCDVTLAFGSSRQLKNQIEQGAKWDVFVSADKETVNDLIKGGRAFGAMPLAECDVVIAVRRYPRDVETAADLAKPGVRFVTAQEGVPIAKYGEALLKKLSASGKLGGDFAEKVRSNYVSRELNVKQAVAKVLLGEADACFCYATDILGNQNLRALNLPPKCGVRATFYFTVPAKDKVDSMSDTFIRFVTKGKAQRSLKALGFAPISSSEWTRR